MPSWARKQDEMADFHLAPLARPLYVKGADVEGATGEFEGEVLAIGVRGTDPVIPATPDGPDLAAEGLLGWGSTHLLVADEAKPFPVWVPKSAITEHRVGSRDEHRARTAAEL